MNSFKVKCVKSSSEFFKIGETYNVKDGILYLSGTDRAYSSVIKYNDIYEINADMIVCGEATKFAKVYPEYIMKTLRQRLGLDESDTSKDNYLNTLSKNEVLYEVCQWDGLLGYDTIIKRWVNDIYDIDLDNIN